MLSKSEAEWFLRTITAVANCTVSAVVRRMLFGGISWEVFIIQTTMDNFMNDSHVHGIKVATRFQP
jgi:hypothetical protein